MVSPLKPIKKDLYLISAGEKNYIEVLPNHTLSDVRLLIQEEFDPEQLPDKGCDQFSFRVNEIRISEKQECKKMAFDLIQREAVVELVSKSKGVKRALEESDGEKKEFEGKKKKCADGFVTPLEGKEGEAHHHDSSVNESAEKEGDNESTVEPMDLDDKFAKKNDVKDLADIASNGVETGACSEFTMPLKEANDVTEESNVAEAEKSDDTAAVEGHGADATDVAVTETTDKSNDKSSEGTSDNEKVSFDTDIGDKMQMNKGNDSTSEEDDEEVTFDTNTQSNSANEMQVDSTTESSAKDEDLPPKKSKDGSLKEPESDEELQVITEENPHKESNEAKDVSKKVLNELTQILQGNPDFCTEDRRNELLQDIKDVSESSTPRTVFGVLGNTGVGKSSLLNALLDEASVLPTSGSRGCTAAVVELVFHSEMVKKADDPDKKVPVYKGEVEFITLEDWRKELKVLVEECSTQEKTIYALPPKPDVSPDAAAAWQKIEQVYGRKSMERFCTLPTDQVYNTLSNDMQVKRLLTPTDGKEYNSIIVNVGEVTPGSGDVKELLKPFSQMKSKMKTQKKKWAMDFRAQINNYVYRKGNGDARQTWPLIHKVELQGPWSVLSTGAVLVDLPGVRDSNAARAKVAERYLQNCNQIAIVASIKRAVDDGTAKELMGEQFKRRLLMDGNYGNVFFICTQTDDLEATETMRDHQDIAEEVPGRWEKMTDLAEVISDLEGKISETLQEKEGLLGNVEDAKQELKEILDDLKEAKSNAKELKESLDDLKEEAQNSDEYEDDEAEYQEALDLISSLETLKSSKVEEIDEAEVEVQKWVDANKTELERVQAKCDCLQKKLKAICAAVRNEYSTRCLQEDFKSGLKELYRKDDDEDADADGGKESEVALPDEFDMDVFCISANDYLKVMGIKPRRDGPPSTFASATDTQIPQLRSYVHACTARLGEASVKTFVEHTNDVLDRIKLIAGDIEEVPSGRSGFRMKSAFQTAMSNLSRSIEPISLNFKNELDKKIEGTLSTSLKTGALKGSQDAMSTVHSWGSKSRRTKDERRPDKNGLYWSTYNAVARREGVYTSPTVGSIDFNQELVDPMESAMSTEWQAVLDSLIRRLLSDAEKKVLELSTQACQSLSRSLSQLGVDAGRLASMLNAANRSAFSALKSSFHRMQVLAVDSQREISRELLPSIKEKMRDTYEAAAGVERGSGRFDRMKHAMASSSQDAVRMMFDDARALLLGGVKDMVNRLKEMISKTVDVISKAIESVFSIMWDSSKTNAQVLIDPAVMKKIREVRNALLPDLNKLVDAQRAACKLLGIEREDIELDVLGVETFEQGLERRLEEAKKKGAVFDVSNSDDEDDATLSQSKHIKVKSEKRSGEISASPSGDQDVINLCDSDDDEEDAKQPAAGNVQNLENTSVDVAVTAGMSEMRKTQSKLTTGARLALRAAILANIKSSGGVDPVLLGRAMKENLPSISVINACNVAKNAYNNYRSRMAVKEEISYI